MAQNNIMQLEMGKFDEQTSTGKSTIRTKLIGIDYNSGVSGVDASTETLQVIDYEHHEIHSGNHYNYCDYALNQSSGAVIEFVMTTADTDALPHLTFYVSSSDGATIELYSGTSGITGGTAITPRNNRTDSIKVSGVTLIKDPASITSDGTRTAGYLAGGNKDSGFIKRENELVLTRNTAYLVRITSLAVSNDISWCAEWYEHTDKN